MTSTSTGTEGSSPPAMEPTPSYPLPAYLRFCPGGISLPGNGDSGEDWYDLASYSHTSNTAQEGSQTPRSTRRRVLSPDVVVSKARLADDRLRKFILLYGKDTSLPHFLPSLSALADAAFNSLTGVPPSAVRRWTDSMVLQYLDDAQTLETIPSSEEEAYNSELGAGSVVDDTVVAVLRRLADDAKQQHHDSDDRSVSSRGGARTRPCGYVFQRGDIAWNCRTCQADATCVLCDTCFHASNHEGHEVFFHRTTPGGCCDCGDPEAWKPEGCCAKHRPQSTPKASPQELSDVTEEVVRTATKAREEAVETLTSAETALPPRLAAALGVVIGSAVQCLVEAADGAGIGADPSQWKLRWADDASRVWNGSPNDEYYSTRKASPTVTPRSFLGGDEPQLSLPSGYLLHLRLHNDDVHTFDEVISAMHEPRTARRNESEQALVIHREKAEELTNHVDADGQVIVKECANVTSAMQGYRRLKRNGLHCAVVGTSQLDLEQRARALSLWLAEVSAAHPAAAVLVVHALVQVNNQDQNIAGIHVWNQARTIPSWAAFSDRGDELQECRRRFQAFPPHLESSYLRRDEAERLLSLGLELNASSFVDITGTDASFYENVPYRLPSRRYCKSPHALWGTLPSKYSDTIPSALKHPLLARLCQENSLLPSVAENMLVEDVLVIDTDLRKQQEAERLTSSVYPSKLPGLHIISGLGTISPRSVSKTPPPLPSSMEWRHLISTCSFRAPVSPILLLLLLDPYPTKQFRANLHALFLKLLVDSRFKCRFAAALGGVAYRSLSTLFCAGVGTEADSLLGFTVQIFTAGSLVRALGNSSATRKLLLCENGIEHEEGGSPVGTFTLPIAHTVVRCIHTNLLGASKEVQMILNNTSAGNDDDSEDETGDSNRNENLIPALTYCAGEHPLTTQLPASPDDGFLDSRSTRHKRLPHLLRDLEYIIETPATAVRLLLPQKFPIYPVPLTSPRLEDIISFPTVWARLLRLAQGMDPQKRKISGGHIEYEQNRWLEAFGLSLNLASTRDALTESSTNSSSTALTPLASDGSHLVSIREAMGNLFAALLRELKLWLYREGMLETGLPLPPGGGQGALEASLVEALQRSTLHFSSSQISTLSSDDGSSGNVAPGGSKNAVALSCATGVKMTEAQLDVIESALRMEESNTLYRGAPVEQGGLQNDSSRNGPAMGDWLRVPHSPLAGDSLSFHLPLHRALAKSVRSLCTVVVPETIRSAYPNDWWKLPVLDEEFRAASLDSSGPCRTHPLVALLRPTLRSANCRVNWSAGPDCTPAEAQRRRARSKAVSAAIASAKIVHSIADHPIRCLAAAQQIERHLWARNGTSTAGMALNYSSAPLCRSFRDLDLSLVQLSAAGLSIGLGARRVFSLLISRFSMDGYLCDPERRVQGSSSSASYGTSIWVNPPRLQDPDHAVALSESFFTTLCLLVTELPSPPPLSPVDDTALETSVRRELLHALAAEPRSHSEAMAAASSAVSRRDDSDNISGSSGGGGVFRDVFAKVLREIGKQKFQGNARAASGPPAFELRADCCHEYDPTFFHLRRQEHQHAMDNVARLRKQAAEKESDKSRDKKCLPLVCAPPKAHPRFVPCRLILHLSAMDAALRRALLFALTGGSWLPPPEPTPQAVENADSIEITSTTVAHGASGTSSAVPVTTFTRRGFKRSSSSQISARSFNDSEDGPEFSPSVVAGSSVSFLEVLQLLTLQVHTLEECASLHRTQIDLDGEAKALSASLSINSYLGRLIHVPDTLQDVWALSPPPAGPLPSKGSGENRGSVLGLLIALYEYRADHGGDMTEGETNSSHSDEDHGGARTLAASGLKWLLRFVSALVDGAPSVKAACQSATSGIPVQDALGSSASSGSTDPVRWTIDSSIKSTVSRMLSNIPDLWPKHETHSSAPENKKSTKNKEARMAAQRRVMEMMKQKQSAFAASIASTDGDMEKGLGGEESSSELCIICRCDDDDGESNGPLGYLGHVQRSRAAHIRTLHESNDAVFSDQIQNTLFHSYRVVGDHGCQLRESEQMDSTPIACLPMGSIVSVLKRKVSEKYGLLCRRVLVRHVADKFGSGQEKITEGWASLQSSQGYVILSPLTSVCFSSTRWGSTRPFVRQCGHAAHLKCVEAHVLSLHQRAAGEQPYDGRFAANIDDGEFLCPLCKQLSNILIPRDINAREAANTTSGDKATTVSTAKVDTDTGGVRGPFGNDHHSLRRLLALKSKASGVQDKKALEDFGAHLLQAMEVPWERTTAIEKKAQRRWNSAIKRWDYEDEAFESMSSSEAGSSVKNVLRLLRQQHIAWAAVGHSASAAEASSRGVEESLPFGLFAKTSDPWSDYSDSVKDSHPLLQEMRRTLNATSGLLEVLAIEMNNHFGDGTATDRDAFIVGSCLGDILYGRSWMREFQCNSSVVSEPSSELKRYSMLTALLSSLPCHTARDGTISPRHEARAVAAAMWTVNGVGINGTSEPADAPSDSSIPPTPLAVREVLSAAHPGSFQLPANWGTMDAFIFRNHSSANASSDVPFRPAIASAFLHIPLLAWDLNTLTGAIFSTMLTSGVDDLPTNDDLLLVSRLLLVGRIIQTIITPCGYHLSASEDEGMDFDSWTEKEVDKEDESLGKLVSHISTRMKSRSCQGPLVVETSNLTKKSGLFGPVGQAILPFARSLVILLRACSSAVRERHRAHKMRPGHSSDEKRDVLDSILFDEELMACEDGFLFLKAMGGPLPSHLVTNLTAEGSLSWSVLIGRWLDSVVGLEIHHGSKGASILSGSSPLKGDSVSSQNGSGMSTEEEEDRKRPHESPQRLSHSGVQDDENLSVSIESGGDASDSLEESEEEEDAIMEDAVIVLGPDGDVEESDDEMEVEVGEETIGFLDNESTGNSPDRSRSNVSTDVFDESSDENDSNPDEVAFASVSSSPILPYQPSLLGTVIGPGPRGSSMELSAASSLMCDMSHLGMIHRHGVPTVCLVRLPKSFVELYGLVNRIKGRSGAGEADDADDSGMSETALCLLTGAVMRSGSLHRRTYSRTVRPPGACTLHARKIGSGTGIFFLVQKCKVLLMHNNKSAYSASLYVDEHGEEDPGLRRGRPLFLHEARYRALELLWREHKIPREVAQIRSTSDRVIRDNWY